jgi:hypothetical protein
MKIRLILAPMSPNTCNDVETGNHLHKPHNPINDPIVHVQPFTAKFFSGNFLQQSDFDRCNPIQNYTLSNAARQEIIM